MKRDSRDVLDAGRLHVFPAARWRGVAHIEADLQNFLKRHYPEASGAHNALNIHSLSEVHLAPAGRFPCLRRPDPRTLWTLALVVSLVLLLAVINFVNLMTARAGQRAVEVGVRKSAGAGRGNLMAQFLGESCLYVFAAVLVAMALVELRYLPSTRC